MSTHATILTVALAAICSMGYAQNKGTDTDKSAITPKTADAAEKAAKNEDDEVYFIVPKMPEFPGGDSALRRFITENLRYPEEAKANGMSGKVFVQFVINKNGEVENPQIARGVEPALNKEAIRVIQSLPKWKPGQNKSKWDNEWRPVRVSFTIPVDFKLE